MKVLYLNRVRRKNSKAIFWRMRQKDVNFKVEMDKIRTRFAPSPTGDLHIGSLRTALYSYALAKHGGGDFILRIEDTDKKREVKGSRSKIKKQLKLFGLDWDEYYEQSARVREGIYKKQAEKLVSKGHAYYCQCKPKDPKAGYSKVLRDPCRDKGFGEGAIKLRIPDNEKIGFTDFVLGKRVEWDSSLLSDTTLLKSNGFPTYHLAVVVDDHDMKITHALRGHDWLPSTPIHLLVYKYLGYKVSEIGHLTDILDPQGGKLSKRKGTTNVSDFIGRGYLPDAILNFVMLLGWAPKDNREMFSLDEFVGAFNVRGLQIANPTFNVKKLDWFSGEYIREMDNEKLADMIDVLYRGKYPKEQIGKITPLIKERISTLREFETLAGFFFKSKKVNKGYFERDWKKQLKGASDALDSLKVWNKDSVDKALIKLVKDKGYHTGNFFMNLRVAITGSRTTPPINESLVILGQKETLNRLKDTVAG